MVGFPAQALRFGEMRRPEPGHGLEGRADDPGIECGADVPPDLTRVRIVP